MKINLELFAGPVSDGKPVCIKLAENSDYCYYLIMNSIVSVVKVRTALFLALHDKIKNGQSKNLLCKESKKTYNSVANKTTRGSRILECIIKNQQEKIKMLLEDGEDIIEGGEQDPKPSSTHQEVKPIKEKRGATVETTETKKKTTKKATAKKATVKKTQAKVAKKTAEKKIKNGPVAQVAKATAKKKTSKKVAKKPSTGRKPVIQDILSKKIKVIVKTPPKRKRFGLYKDGMTVEKLLKDGGNLRDVKWDVKQKFISLS